MANAGVLRYESISIEDANAFLRGKMIIQPGVILLIDSEGVDTGQIFFGVGKSLDETPSISYGILSRIIALEGGAVGAPPWPISYVENLQLALDSKAALMHTHTEGDVTGLVDDLAALSGDITALYDALASVYKPGITAVNEGTF